MNLKRLRTRIGVPVALIAVLVLALPGSASALGLGEQEEFFAPTQPTQPLTLTKGPDGNVWYTNDGSTKIGKVTPAGVVTEYSPGLAGNAFSITAGPDGNIWFTETGSEKVGYIDPAAPTTSLQEFTVPGMSTLATEASFITAGPDGNLWLTLGLNGIARVTPAGVVTEFTAGLNTEAEPCSIIPGPDGNVWFGDCATETGNEAIGKITPAGAITEFPVLGNSTNRPSSITFGSDGRIWFAAAATGPARQVGAITTAGVVTYYAAGTVFLTGFVTGADGNVWAKEATGKNERQTLTIKVNPTSENNLGGTFKLSCPGGGEETEPIAYNASEATVEEKLGALTCIGGVANVKGLPGGTTSLSTTTRTIEFEGKFARTDVAMLGCNPSGLTGTAPTCVITQAIAALPVRLFRIEPSGTSTSFPLAPKTLTPTPISTGKGGTVARGPDSSLWFTVAGDPLFPSTPAIGKFGLGIESAELTVTKTEGNGDGTVVSSPAGIECGGTCSAEFIKNTQVTLTASPDSESLFVSWKGCESGGAQGRQCKVTMDAAKTVKAKFEPANDVTVEKAGDGTGSISGVTCGNTCTEATAAFLASKTVTLKAKPYVKNSEFVGWSASPASCTLPEGPKGPCTLSGLTEDQTVEAEFAELDRETLTVAKSGNGQGTVKSSPAGINCSYTCSSNSAYFYKGTTVTLTATVQAGKGSTLGNWGGACSGTAATPCVVTMSEAKEVTVGFN